MGAKLMAIVAEGDRGRVYLAPTPEHESIVQRAEPMWKPQGAMPDDRRWFSPPIYGLPNFADLFTDRQLVALTTFSDLVAGSTDRVQRNAVAAGVRDDGVPLRNGGAGATAYAEAVGVYLAFTLSKQADLGNSLCRWEPIAQCPRQLFGRQAIPMVGTTPKATRWVIVQVHGTFSLRVLLRRFKGIRYYREECIRIRTASRRWVARGFPKTRSYPLIHHTTTTLATPTCQTSFTSGCAVRWGRSSPTSLPH